MKALGQWSTDGAHSGFQHMPWHLRIQKSDLPGVPATNLNCNRGEATSEKRITTRQGIHWRKTNVQHLRHFHIIFNCVHGMGTASVPLLAGFQVDSRLAFYMMELCVTYYLDAFIFSPTSPYFIPKPFKHLLYFVSTARNECCGFISSNLLLHFLSVDIHRFFSAYLTRSAPFFEQRNSYVSICWKKALSLQIRWSLSVLKNLKESVTECLLEYDVRRLTGNRSSS